MCFKKRLKQYVSVINQATGYASQHIWCLSQARINWEGCARKGIRHENGGDGIDGAPISLDRVAVHPDCWCICLCYLHFAPENPDTHNTTHNHFMALCTLSGITWVSWHQKVHFANFAVFCFFQYKLRDWLGGTSPK